MDKYNKLCKKRKIITLTPQEFDVIHLNHDVPPQTREAHDRQPSAAIRLSKGPFIKHFILTPDDAHEIHKWHELGHILHPAGGMQGLDWDKTRYGTLINELAASYWAITQNDLPKSMQLGSLEELQWALSTYLDKDYDTCPDNDIFRVYARKLQMEQLITWKTFKSGEPTTRNQLSEILN